MRWRVFLLYLTARKIALGNTWVTDGKEIAGYTQYSPCPTPSIGKVAVAGARQKVKMLVEYDTKKVVETLHLFKTT